MRRILYIAVALFLLAPSSGLKGQAPAGEFLTPDLAGWEGLKEHWSFKDGALVGAAPEGLKFNTFLVSKKPYGDFELSFQVKLSKAANSGLQIRSKLVDGEKYVVHGPQCDMAKGYWGSLFGEHFGEGGKHYMIKAADPEAVKKAVSDDTAFIDYSIKAVGKRVTIKLNGETTVDGEFPELPGEGIFGWQLHSGKPMEVVFRNIRFRDLSKK